MTARRLRGALAAALLATALASAVGAWELEGTRAVRLHGRDGRTVDIGSVDFAARADGRVGFALRIDHTPFKDFFLSMKEFKCLEVPDEVFCHVPYPYAHPGTVAASDLTWLEHGLLFLYKKPGEFGARLWNGVYYRLAVTERGLVGTPQAIDLNLISAPPARSDVPPYRPALRDDIAPGSRWFGRLTIE